MISHALSASVWVSNQSQGPRSREHERLSELYSSCFDNNSYRVENLVTARNVYYIHILWLRHVGHSRPSGNMEYQKYLEGLMQLCF